MIDEPPFDFVAKEEAVLAAYAECGFSPESIRVERLDDPPGLQLVIPENSGATVERIDCVAAASAGVVFEFEAYDLRLAYFRSAVARVRPIMFEIANARLSEIGLLDGLPTLESHVSVEALAPAIEEHCGIDAGRVLAVEEERISFRQTTLQERQEVCLLEALTLTGLREFEAMGIRRPIGTDG